MMYVTLGTLFFKVQGHPNMCLCILCVTSFFDIFFIFEQCAQSNYYLIETKIAFSLLALRVICKLHTLICINTWYYNHRLFVFMILRSLYIMDKYIFTTKCTPKSINIVHITKVRNHQKVGTGI